ncbi:hypothetical protein [Caballeronia zhejiangensis]|jgi:hypothetical protein|uniref:hypothetical protein n=1 Tax=Caballeronia zhejiangensis TaxID=871203 RepID=UPI001FD163CE|nr:hypothetical protein [Caballeronia zhejiangensis]
MANKAKHAARYAAFLARVEKHQEMRQGMMFGADGKRTYGGPEKVDCRNSATAVYVKPRRVTHLPM